MSRILRLLFAVMLLVVLPTIASSATAGSMTSTAATTITIDGIAAGAVLSWEGGDPRASVVSLTNSADGSVSKHPTGVVFAPLVVQVAFPPAGPLRDWLGELCANQTPRRKIVLTDYDATGSASFSMEFNGTTLAEVRFPALDAASAAIGNLTFVFVVEDSRQIAPAGAGASSAARAAGTAFRLVVDDLNGSGVMRIGTLSIVRKLISDQTGEMRIAQTSLGAAEYSNLLVTLQGARSATWRAWFDDFVLKGNSGDESEKSGTLEFLSADMKQVVFALHFGHLGILRLSRVSTAAGAPELVEAELYFEKLSTGTAPTSGSADSTHQAGGEETQQSTGGVSEIKGDTPEETSTAGGSPGEAGTPEGESTEPLEAMLMEMPPPEMATGMLSDATNTDTSGATTVNVSDRFAAGGATVSDSTTSPTRAGTIVGTTSTAVTNTNPADQGSRDPAGFPRVAGLTRLDFSGQYHTTSTSEESHYTTPDKIYDLLAKIDAAAKAAGWTLGNFAEGYSQGGKWVTEQWKKDNSTVALQIDQPDTGITRYWIRVTTQIPEAN